MSFNSKYIFPGDDKNEILSKINYNFGQIYFNAVGSPGPMGEYGPTGMIGPVGLDGLTGLTGSPAVRWFFSADPPIAADSTANDIWVNIGITGFQRVYFYDGSNWVDSGENILQDSEFEAITGVSGPGGSTTHNSIIFSGLTASDYSLVISDAVGTTANVNPNLSKLVVSTNSINEEPILGFNKTFVGSPTLPSFNWTGPTAESYGISFDNPGETRILLGTTGSFSATGGSGESMILAGNTFVQVTSQNQIFFESSTGATGSLILNTPANILMNSSNKILTSNSLAYRDLTDSSGLTADASTLINASGNQGLNIQILGPGPTSGTPIYTFENPAGYRILETRSNNLTVIGETGPSGSASGCLVKKIDIIDSYSLNGRSGSQFKANGFFNNYASLEINGDNSDVICINAYYDYLFVTGVNTPIANGEYYSIYLQLSGFQNISPSFPANPGVNNSFLTTTGRVFDVFLEDKSGIWLSGYISFGGIRTVYPGGSSSVAISNNTYRCYHIRLIFINDRTIFYQFNYSGTANRCGLIPYVYTGPVSGGGGIGSS